MRLKDGTLRLSNGRSNEPLVLVWPWGLPQTIVIHWIGTGYEAIATYKQVSPSVQPLGDKVAGIDLGEVHMAVSHDGERDIRHENDIGSKNNQKIHQWSFGMARYLLSYKAERHGMHVALQEEDMPGLHQEAQEPTMWACVLLCQPAVPLDLAPRWSGSL